MILTGKIQSTWENICLSATLSKKFPRGLALNPNQAPAVTGWHLTTRAMAQPVLIKLKKSCF